MVLGLRKPRSQDLDGFLHQFRVHISSPKSFSEPATPQATNTLDGQPDCTLLVRNLYRTVHCKIYARRHSLVHRARRGRAPNGELCIGRDGGDPRRTDPGIGVAWLPVGRLLRNQEGQIPSGNGQMARNRISTRGCREVNAEWAHCVTTTRGNQLSHFPLEKMASLHDRQLCGSICTSSENGLLGDRSPNGSG
jgi:hypothetical protein